jgi:hypothetical protein
MALGRYASTDQLFRETDQFPTVYYDTEAVKNSTKCSTNKGRQFPPASLTGISLIPSETHFRLVREAGYEPKSSQGKRVRRGFAEKLLTDRKARQSRWLQQGSKNGRKLLKLVKKRSPKVY